MKVPRSNLAEIIGERSLKETNLNHLAKEIAAYLLSENRVNELESLIRDVMAYRQTKGVIEADVVSAHELSNSVNKEVTDILRGKYPKAKKIIIHDSLDSEIIGGVKVNLANEQLDLSIRAKLDTFKRLTTEGIF